LAKREQEKTNKESEDAVFIRRYNDSVQRENIRIKEEKQSILRAHKKEKRDSIIAKSILPPSKLDMGSKFNMPRKSDDKINRSRKSHDIGINNEKNTHKKFMAGPAAQINISLEKEPMFELGISAAPNGDSLISRNFTLDIRAAAICPSS
jgi:hypothetical protein